MPRWRSSVQILPGTPFLSDEDSAVRKLASGEPQTFAPCALRDHRATETCVGWALVSLSGCNPPALRALQVQLLPGALPTWPVRLKAGFQVLNLERRIQLPRGSVFRITSLAPRRSGFDSPAGPLNELGSWSNGTSAAPAWRKSEFDSRWVH